MSAAGTAWEGLYGWKWKKLTAGGAEDEVVKATGGLVAKLAVQDAVTCYLKDGSSQAWVETSGSALAEQNFDPPLQCDGAISVNFSGAGDAWVLYK